MNLFRELAAKPWLTPGLGDRPARDETEQAVHAARNALKLFFAVIAVIFLLLVIAYGERMTYEDWRPLPESTLLWFNTVALLLGSVAMQWAVASARRGRNEDMKMGLFSGGVASAVFVAGQLLAWRQLVQMGYFEPSDPAIAFFVLITGLHALHILGGFLAWGRIAFRLWMKGAGAEQVRLSVELCTLYWHYLLIVWLVLFGLLFAGNSNLATLMAICGIR